MKINVPNESYIKNTCEKCNVSLSVFKDDIKKDIIYKKGDSYESYRTEEKEFDDYKEIEDIVLTTHYNINNRVKVDTYESYFDCIVCKYKNIIYVEMDYNNHKGFVEFVSEKLDKYTIDCYDSDNSLFEDKFPELEITEKVYNELKDKKSKDIVEYLLKLDSKENIL